MDQKPTVVHVTHESTGKIGGIGAVLDGMFTSHVYDQEVGRTIIVGALYSTEGNVSQRLGDGGQVLYSSLDGLIRSNYHQSFRRIEYEHGVEIVYGRRQFTDPMNGVSSQPEVLLIDVSRMEKNTIDHFKGRLFREFGIRSDRYEWLWDYEQWVRLAVPSMIRRRLSSPMSIWACRQRLPLFLIHMILRQSFTPMKWLRSEKSWKNIPAMTRCSTM